MQGRKVSSYNFGHVPNLLQSPGEKSRRVEDKRKRERKEREMKLSEMQKIDRRFLFKNGPTRLGHCIKGKAKR